MLCGTIILSMIAWVVSARKWFKGPVSSRGGVLAPVVMRVGPMACSSSRCPVLPRQPASTRCPLTCSMPPTPAPRKVRNVDVGNKTETLAEAAMRGECCSSVEQPSFTMRTSPPTCRQLCCFSS